MASDLNTDVLAAIAAAERGTWSGVAFRHTAPERPALSGSGAALFGGRWNPPGTAAIYLTTSIDARVAEFKRMARGQARGVESFLPRDPHDIEVTDLIVLDLTRALTRKTISLTLGDIRSRDWNKCQAIGRHAQIAGFQGVRAPSATRQGDVIVAYDASLRRGQIEVVATRPLRI